MEKWKQIGVVGVDSGTLMITDPCYVTGDNWSDKDYDKYVCGQMRENSLKIPFPKGHDGKAVLTSTGFGDGCYPVYQIEKNYKVWGKRVVGIMVLFDELEVKKSGKKIQKSKK